MRNRIVRFIFLLVLVSCSEAGTRSGRVDALSGTKVDIGPEESIFQLVYADDSLVIGSTFSGGYALECFERGDSVSRVPFLRVGRGPKEVNRALCRAKNDTIFALACSSYGISGCLSIPVKQFNDISSWSEIRFPEELKVNVSGGIDVNGSESLFCGGRWNEKEILSSLDLASGRISWTGLWPDDGQDENALAKQSMYTRNASVFCFGEKIFYACGEGRYASIVDRSVTPCSETVIYDEYPVFSVSEDGLNPRRDPSSHIGVRAFATEGRIYLSPIVSKLKGGVFIPDNFKGYPPDYNDIVDVYDWDGKYIRTYRLDVPFCGFYVSPDDSRLYTLSVNMNDSFSEVYEYDLPS